MTAETLFDLAEFEREAVAATAWDGAPLAYTTSYYSPAELDAAFDRYRAEFGGFGEGLLRFSAEVMGAWGFGAV